MSLEREYKPKSDLCFGSKKIKLILGTWLNNAEKNSVVRIVIFISGCLDLSNPITGTVMATSPNEDSLMINKCLFKVNYNYS